MFFAKVVGVWEEGDAELLGHEEVVGAGMGQDSVALADESLGLMTWRGMCLRG